MSTQIIEPVQDSTVSLFIGLQSYSEAQSDIFYGRDEEIDRLTNLINANTLTIVFGKSGTGKTSLLNAGVFPRLRRNYCLPFRIRLEFRDDSPDLVSQIKNILKSEIDTYGFEVEAYPSAETLWEYFHSEPLWKSVTPILIFGVNITQQVQAGFSIVAPLAFLAGISLLAIALMPWVIAGALKVGLDD